MQPAAGQSIAVYGVGGVGLAGLMSARIAGCDPIIAVDRLPSRLTLARELGATHTLESRGAETLAEMVSFLRYESVDRDATRNPMIAEGSDAGATGIAHTLAFGVSQSGRFLRSSSSA